MGNSYFQFKQFLINQDKCAMKVGTDSVLLALLHTYKNEKTALDIGTGSGIITLMMAQLNPDLIIDAIEIDNDAYAQASENISNSIFSNRIKVIHTSLQDYYSEKKYDLIITNPPYYEAKNNFGIKNIQRAKARHDNELPFDVLIQKAKSLLNPNGVFVLILPTQEATLFKEKAEKELLFENKSIYIKPKKTKPVNRLIMQFSLHLTTPIKEEFIIYEEDNSQTQAFKNLVKDFYL
jgi:tRNA1Val (adenine37-N6)-methyltransferase